MEIDPARCYQAALSRDRRFDGRFFTGVVTTGIYCRPVCPVVPPKFENMRFYPCAAAAEAAGALKYVKINGIGKVEQIRDQIFAALG